MKNEIQKFLEFNGKNILFISKDGQYWVAVKPICEALNINYNRQFQNLKKDEILRAVFAKQQMQVPSDQVREMICLPEKFIYGWIFQVRSDSPELLLYKWQCYQILYDYFNGSITKRHQILREQKSDWDKIKSLRNKLDTNSDYKELKQLEKTVVDYNSKLKECDKELIQLDMFTN